jgi:hypothetical protein
VAVAAAAVVTIGSSNATAAEIPNPVVDVVVTPSNPRIGERIRTDMEFCVPDSTAEGDFFSVVLPPELTFMPSGFDVRDPDGLLVADATLAGSPVVVTFTFTDYVDTRTDVCGSAFFESRFDDTLTVGEQRQLDYVVNGVAIFDVPFTPREKYGIGDDDIVGKGGFFTDDSDQCRTSLDSCLEWHVRSRVGPYDSVQISDDGIPGVSFECDEVQVTLRRVEPNGALGGYVSLAAAGVTTVVECGDGVDVTVNDLPADLIVRLVLRGTPDAPSPAGGIIYENAAVITHIVENEIVARDEVSVSRRSSEVGGEAVGVTPATTTTTTTTAPTTTTTTTTTPAAATTTTTTAAATTTTTTPAATTTTIVASGAATTTVAGSGAASTTVAPSSTVATQLPATGSGPGLAPAAAVLLLAGLGLVTVASRRTT